MEIDEKSVVVFFKTIHNFTQFTIVLQLTFSNCVGVTLSEINGKSNPKRNASDEPKLPLKQRFLNVFRRKSNKVGPLEVKSSDGPTGENPQEQNDSDCDAASQVDLEDKSSSSVHDNTKLTPNVSAEPQCPSRSK